MKKPKWLRRLEQESWQAELVISGVAIFGSLQLPGWINQGVVFSIGTFNQEFLDFLQYVFVYGLIGSQLLIFNFVLHFSMRTLWIGMVGLASVYPAGINNKEDKFSQDYFSKLREMFPDLNAFNRRLDDQCSSIFALAAVTVLSLSSISILLIAVVVLSHLLYLLFPALPFSWYVYGIFGFFMFISAIQGILGARMIREKQWVKAIHFPLYRATSFLIFNFFFKPANYIFLTFYTNSGKGRFWGGYVAYIIILMLVSVAAFMSSDILFMDEDFRHRRQGRTDQLYAYSYDNLRGEKAFIPFASLEADVITGKQLAVFVPVPQYEKKAIFSRCGDYQGDEGDREEKRQFEMNCLRQYYQFFVNDSLYTDVALFRYTHPGSGQAGIRVYLPTDAFRPGPNLFRIGWQPSTPNDGRPGILIPFQFYPE